MINKNKKRTDIALRILAGIITFIVIFAFTKQLTLAFGTAIVVTIVQLIISNVHDRTQNRITSKKVKTFLSDTPGGETLTAEQKQIICKVLQELGYID